MDTFSRAIFGRPYPRDVIQLHIFQDRLPSHGLNWLLEEPAVLKYLEMKHWKAKFEWKWQKWGSISSFGPDFSLRHSEILRCRVPCGEAVLPCPVARWCIHECRPLCHRLQDQGDFNSTQLAIYKEDRLRWGSWLQEVLRGAPRSFGGILP